MAPRPLLPRLPRVASYVLFGDMLSAFGSGLTLPFFLVYLTYIRGVDIAVAGLAVATVAVAGFVGNPVGGLLVDRVGPKRGLMVGLAVASCGAFSVTLVRDPLEAFVAAVIVGFGAAVVWPAQDALLAVVVNPNDRSNIFAIRNATLNAGYGFGALVAALIVDLHSANSFVVLYVIDGLTFLAFIPLLAWLIPSYGVPALESNGASSDAHVQGYRTVIRDRVFVRVWFLFALLVTVGFAQTQSGFPAYATSVGGMNASGLALAFAANTFTVVVAQLFVLRHMEGKQKTTGIIIACLLWAAAWIITLASGSLGEGTIAIVGFTAALVVFGLGETFLAPSQAALVNDLAPDALRGRYNGLYTLAWTTGFAIGPAAAGIALGAGQGALLLGLLIAACLLAALFARNLAHHLPARANLVGTSHQVS